MSKQVNNIWLPLLISAVLAAGIYVGFRLQGSSPLIIGPISGALGSGGSSIDEVLHYIDAKYVDEPDQTKLREVAIRKVLDELDPHSTFIPARELQSLNEQMEGTFEGIGIEFLVINDTLTVVSSLSDGPAHQAGVLAGDQIIQVEDSIITQITERNIDPASLMRGISGSDVTIFVQRNKEKNLRKFTLTRAPIPVYSVDAAYLLNDLTAYIKINRFSATTYDEFVMALEQLLEKEKARHLVIDLRDNPGGYLQQATKLLSQLFLQKGILLVYTEGRKSRRVEYKSNGRAFYRIQNIAILVNESSASASEIVAGAVQDHDRGIIVGRRTFGKGLVQEQYGLSDNSALRLTIARYYTPSGRSIQRSYDEGNGEYRDEIHQRYTNGELSGETTAKLDSTLTYYTDGGHTVYGGGGITPDYFVPLDSTFKNETFLRLRQEIPAYVFEYLRKHPSVKDYDNIEEFRKHYQIDFNEVLRALRVKAIQTYNEPLGALPKEMVPKLALFFKARVARALFENDSFIKIMNEKDDIVQETLRLLDNDDPVAAARDSEQ